MHGKLKQIVPGKWLIHREGETILQCLSSFLKWIIPSSPELVSESFSTYVACYVGTKQRINQRINQRIKQRINQRSCLHRCMARINPKPGGSDSGWGEGLWCKFPLSQEGSGDVGAGGWYVFFGVNLNGLNVMYMRHNINSSNLRATRKYLLNNSTSTEAELWKYLSGKKFCGIKFRRQYNFRLH